MEGQPLENSLENVKKKGERITLTTYHNVKRRAVRAWRLEGVKAF